MTCKVLMPPVSLVWPTSYKFGSDFPFFYFVYISACKFTYANFCLIGWHAISWSRSWFQDGGKISPCVDLKSRRNNCSVQFFKTMQGVYGWIGLFDIVFAAYCSEIFVPASFVFYLTCHLLSDRGFRCWLLYVVLLFRHHFMVLPKSTQNTRESIQLQWVKDAMSLSCAQLLIFHCINSRSALEYLWFKRFINIQYC